MRLEIFMESDGARAFSDGANEIVATKKHLSFNGFGSVFCAPRGHLENRANKRPGVYVAHALSRCLFSRQRVCVNIKISTHSLLSSEIDANFWRPCVTFRLTLPGLFVNALLLLKTLDTRIEN
jgi:hypothetical protein